MKFFKFIAVALFAAAMVGCDNGNEPSDSPAEKSPFDVRVSSNFVQIGVDKAYFIVRLDGVLVAPEELMFFNADDNSEMKLGTTEVELDGQTVSVAEWVPTKPETKSFWVAHKSYSSIDTPVSITAVEFALPAVPTDEQPENVSFTKRSFFTQFTGAGCGYCPFAKAAIYDVTKDEEYADKFLVAACYTFGVTEPMYPAGYGNIATVFGVSNYPTVIFDMKGRLNLVNKDQSFNNNVAVVKSAIDNSLSEPAKAGIAVNVASDSGDTFVARVAVKAAEDGEYYVGAWLLEDDITEKQSNYGCTYDTDFNHHNNVLRIADGGEDFKGHNLGTMKAGEIKDQVFTMTFKTEGKRAWNKDNCRLVVYVTTKAKNGVYVTNCVGNDHYTESIAFEYK